MTAILFKLIPWGTLISLLFTWLAGKFGSGFMKWVLAEVPENAALILTAVGNGLNDGLAQYVAWSAADAEGVMP